MWYGVGLMLLFGVSVVPVVSAQEGPLEEAKALDHYLLRLYQQGRFNDPIPLAQRALAIREEVMGPEHPDTATTLNNLAELYRETGTYAQGEALHQRALAIREKALGPEHSETALSLNHLAELYRDTGACISRRSRSGKRHWDRSIQIRLCRSPIWRGSLGHR
jgi:tetratricopeptide (TPR) repeat protein